MRRIVQVLGFVLLGSGLATPLSLHAEDGYATVTFGASPSHRYPGTLRQEGNVFRFDLSAMPSGTRVARAVLTVPDKGHQPGAEVRVEAIDLAGALPLPLRPPDFKSFDATRAVKTWLANPATNKGLVVVRNGGVDFREAALEVSVLGPVDGGIPIVSRLSSVHQHGQTFLTWREPEDTVGEDAPTFEKLNQAVMSARARRRFTYRVYRHAVPITPGNLGEAELVRETPEAVTGWDLLAVLSTEHPDPSTMRSSLRPGNLVRTNVVARYRLTDTGARLPRDTALAVLTTSTPGTRYYAVTASIDGREAVAAFHDGENRTGPIAEMPARFPAIVHQRTNVPTDKTRASIDTYVFWAEHPYAGAPRPVELFLPRWPDLPKGSPTRRLPLYLNTGTYGTTATEMADAIWHGARRYVGGAFTIGLAEEGTLWAGQHESIGTLRGYGQGVVWNYEQRRVLAATAWALERPDFFVDSERVHIWGQSAGWALRHGDVYAVVMSDGHNNYKTSREGMKHAWKWGPPGGGKNWLGVNHLDYLDLARWVRDNPAIELPFWIGAPAYGTFPSHALGDFGFKPWQEFLSAMMETRRAFAATWMGDGKDDTTGVMQEMVPRIRLHQSMPAFSKGSLDARPLTDQPKGQYHPGKWDQDFQQHADKEGGINLYLRWHTDSIVDETDRWEMTVFLAPKAPADACTVDITPRRSQKFKATPGERFRWSNGSLADQRELQSGEAVVDASGLITLEKVVVAKGRNRIRIWR